MTEITFYGGVDEIGGNIILLETEDSRILFDFGKNFSQESDYFSEFLNPRSSHGLQDYIELGMLPDLDGFYRKDYVNHNGGSAAEEPSVDAVFITHAHMDHIGYIHFLREDIPIYCTPTTEKIMSVIQETGNYTFKEFVEKKRRFHLRGKSRDNGFTKLSSRDKGKDYIETEPVVERPIHKLEDEESVEIGDTRVECLRVNHSLPGAAGFHIETPDTKIVYTGDLRFHGYNGQLTEKFVEKSSEFEPDALITEGTNIGENDVPHEREVQKDLENYIDEENNATFINHPALDLERLRSAAKAAKNNDRKLVVRTKQAHLIEQLEKQNLLPWDDISMSNDYMQVLLPQKGWGTLTQKIKHPENGWEQIPRNRIVENDTYWKLAKNDYQKWERKYIKNNYSVTPRELKQNGLENYLVWMDYYRLKDLIDLQPETGTYLYSKTEPFNQSMMLDQQRIHNWLQKYQLTMKKAHASGHSTQKQITELIHEIKPDTLLPIHTENTQWFQKLTYNQPKIKEGNKIKLN